MKSMIKVMTVGCAVALLSSAPSLRAQEAQDWIVGWGYDYYGQITVPTPNSGFTIVAAGQDFSLGLKIDGSIVAWGLNNGGQCDVPSPNTGFTAVSAGYYHSLGLKAGGSVVAWGGSNAYGQTDVPSPNTGFTAVAAGRYHSLGLKTDGSIVAWGRDNDGQCRVPSPNTGFTAVSAGYLYSLGLKNDGSIVAWGSNYYHQCEVPAPNTGFTAVSAGYYYCLGLKADGSIVAWGSNGDGQCNVPSPNTGFTAVAAGAHHSLGLKTGGSIVAWGRNNDGQCNVPSPNERFTAVAAGAEFSLGIRQRPVAVYMAQFRAARSGQGAMVHWAISQPRDLAGFYLWRQEPGRDRVRLSQALLSGQESYDFVDPAPPAGPAEYWLQEVTTDGSDNWYGPAHLAASTIPTALVLPQNHPNPFNPRTTISYSLPKSGRVTLAIYDVRGARVATLVDADLPAGEQSVEWTGLGEGGTPMPSGVYFARLQTPTGLRAVKVTLAR